MLTLGAISRAVRLMLGAISGAISRAVHLMLGAKGEVLSRAVRRVKGEIEYFSSRAYRTRNNIQENDCFNTLTEPRSPKVQFSEREMQVAPAATLLTTYPSPPPGVAHTVERWEYATLPRDPSRTTPASRTRKWCIILSLGLGRSSRAVRACPLSPHGNARLAAPQGVPRSDVVTEKYAAPGKVFSNDGSSHHSYQKRPTLTYGAIPSGPPGTKHTK